jgi:hypothetical protein
VAAGDCFADRGWESRSGRVAGWEDQGRMDGGSFGRGWERGLCLVLLPVFDGGVVGVWIVYFVLW